MTVIDHYISSLLIKDLAGEHTIAEYEQVLDEFCLDDIKLLSCMPVAWLKHRIIGLHHQSRQRRRHPDLSGWDGRRLNRAIIDAWLRTVDSVGIVKSRHLPEQLKNNINLKTNASVHDAYFQVILVFKMNDIWIRLCDQTHNHFQFFVNKDISDEMRSKTNEIAQLNTDLCEIRSRYHQIQNSFNDLILTNENLIEQNETMQWELSQAQEHAPEIQSNLLSLGKAKADAEHKLIRINEQLITYDSILSSQERELQHLRSRPDNSIVTKLFKQRHRQWQVEKAALLSQLETYEKDNILLAEQGLICDCCLVGVKRHVLACNHGLCHECHDRPDVKDCPQCRAPKLLRFSVS